MLQLRVNKCTKVEPGEGNQSWLLSVTTVAASLLPAWRLIRR